MVFEEGGHFEFELWIWIGSAIVGLIIVELSEVGCGVGLVGVG